MNTEIIDIHCHLLPGIDDGAKDMADTLKALHIASEQGIKKIIMTPHFYPNMRILPEYVAELTEKVSNVAKLENIDIDLYTGMECFYFSELPSLLEKGEVLTLAGSRYVLVEFPWETPALQIETGLDRIFEAGFVPILAHYERYRSLTDKTALNRLKTGGCLLQMNYDTVLRRYGLVKRSPFCKDIKSGWVDILSSDCHGSGHRKFCIDKAVARLERNVSQDRLFDMIYKNPLKIISGDVIAE